MKQEIIDLYDEFTHRGLDRRMFMSRLAELAGGTAAAAAALVGAPRRPGRRGDGRRRTIRGSTGERRDRSGRATRRCRAIWSGRRMPPGKLPCGRGGA